MRKKQAKPPQHVAKRHNNSMCGCKEGREMGGTEAVVVVEGESDPRSCSCQVAGSITQSAPR